MHMYTVICIDIHQRCLMYPYIIQTQMPQVLDLCCFNAPCMLVNKSIETCTFEMKTGALIL